MSELNEENRQLREALEDVRLFAVNHSFTPIIERVGKALKGSE